MNLSPLGLAILEFLEDYREEAYLDSGGVPTIGYGHTGPEVKVGTHCTPEQADVWLRMDVAHAESVVTHLGELSQGQFDALVLFVYNVGAQTFHDSTLRTLLDAGDDAAAAQQFLKWDHVKGVENAGLYRRRRIERALFLSYREA
jgi:lysozyme